MSNELKPCPFCGGEAKHARAAHAYHVFCSQCASDVIVSTIDAMTTCQVQKIKLKAFDKWNTRTESDRITQLEKELEEQKAKNLVQAWDTEKLLVVMQSFYIELANGDQKNANAWIVNTLLVLVLFLKIQI